MIYKDFNGMKLSALGMGAMRLPLTDDKARIDEDASAQMVEYAMKNGVNYYDTAWGYHNEQSEIVMGKLLEKYPRDSFFLATKFPGYDVGNMKKVKQIFEKQLEKCRVDYFDFYLFHNVCETNIEAYLDPKYGVYDYLIEQKRNGRIRHLGFSAHGGEKVIKRFLDAYGKDMEFCQLQINYLDWSFQDARGKVELLKKYGIPVWVMEPLRGGKLATLPTAALNVLKDLRPDADAPEWAFRFIQSIPEVVVTLSGMSDLEQLQENVQIFSEDKPLNDAETKALMHVADGLLGGKTVPCTSCSYCVSHCPMQIDIPVMLNLYNEHSFTGGGFIVPMALETISEDRRPDKCAACKSCEAVCPQAIHISEIMAEFAEKLRG